MLVSNNGDYDIVRFRNEETLLGLLLIVLKRAEEE